MSLESIFGLAEKVHARSIVHQTFGHLSPKSNEVYKGYILFTHTCHGSIEVIDYEFKDSKGSYLDASPWIFEHVNKFIGDLVLPDNAIKCRLPRGRVYRFNGTYIKKPDKPSESSRLMIEGEGVFKGKVRRIKIQIK